MDMLHQLMDHTHILVLLSPFFARNWRGTVRHPYYVAALSCLQLRSASALPSTHPVMSPSLSPSRFFQNRIAGPFRMRIQDCDGYQAQETEIVISSCIQDSQTSAESNKTLTTVHCSQPHLVPLTHAIVQIRVSSTSDFGDSRDRRFET